MENFIKAQYLENQCHRRIYITKLPAFMEKMFPEKCRVFKHLVENGFSHVDGIIDCDGAEIEIYLLEMVGEPLKEFFTLWQDGISEPGSCIARYPSLTDMKFESGNHSMELYYVVSDIFTGNIVHAFSYKRLMPKLFTHKTEWLPENMGDTTPVIIALTGYEEEANLKYEIRYKATRLEKEFMDSIKITEETRKAFSEVIPEKLKDIYTSIENHRRLKNEQ